MLFQVKHFLHRKQPKSQLLSHVVKRIQHMPNHHSCSMETSVQLLVGPHILSVFWPGRYFKFSQLGSEHCHSNMGFVITSILILLLDAHAGPVVSFVAISVWVRVCLFVCLFCIVIQFAR
jgi:hypothetical protein